MQIAGTVDYPGLCDHHWVWGLRKLKHFEGMTIPSSVTEIGDSAFRGCTSLEEVTIPDSVTYIGKSAFFGCSSLREVVLEEEWVVIGIDAFEWFVTVVPKHKRRRREAPFATERKDRACARLPMDSNTQCKWNSHEHGMRSSQEQLSLRK